MKRHSLCTVIVGGLVLLAAAQGCSDDDSDNPKPPDVNSGGTSANNGGKANNNGGKANNNGGKAGSGTGNTANTGDGGTTQAGGTGSGNEAGIDNEGGGPDQPPKPTCDLPERGEDDCYNCPKDGEVEQWLNRCVDGDCEPFPNAARLPLLETDGSLPPLPN